MSTTGIVGVAISTTGDEHRMDLLVASVAGWRSALGLGRPLFVTVDGDVEAVRRVRAALPDPVWVSQVGQPRDPGRLRDGRAGVAVNKNTGIEALWLAGCEHLFLSDDDCWPLMPQSLREHTHLGVVHSMVCWGKSRREWVITPDRDGGRPYATWSWPRGAMIYTHVSAIEMLGGMDEAFGPGGHEHVEFSRRIHQAGLTPALYVSPASYYDLNGWGARRWWHAEDMPRPGEPHGTTGSRRRQLTSMRRRAGDWENAEAVMAARDNNPVFVPFRSGDNGRESAILSENL